MTVCNQNISLQISFCFWAWRTPPCLPHWVQSLSRLLLLLLLFFWCISTTSPIPHSPSLSDTFYTTKRLATFPSLFLAASGQPLYHPQKPTEERAQHWCCWCPLQQQKQVTPCSLLGKQALVWRGSGGMGGIFFSAFFSLSSPHSFFVVTPFSISLKARISSVTDSCQLCLSRFTPVFSHLPVCGLEEVEWYKVIQHSYDLSVDGELFCLSFLPMSWSTPWSTKECREN